MELMMCHHFRRHHPGDSSSEERLVGFLKEPASDTGYRFCSMLLLSKDGKLNVHSITRGHLFVASCIGDIPQKHKKSHVTESGKLIEDGFELLRKYERVCLNAGALIDKSAEKKTGVSRFDEPTLIWRFKPRHNAASEDMSIALSEIRSKLALPGAPGYALLFPHYKLKYRVNNKLAMDVIDPLAAKQTTGELKSNNGFEPLLGMLYFNKVYTDLVGSFSFADERGEGVLFHAYRDYEAELVKRFGFNQREVREIAVQLGLANELIDLSSLHIDVENFFI